MSTTVNQQLAELASYTRLLVSKKLREDEVVALLLREGRKREVDFSEEEAKAFYHAEVTAQGPEPEKVRLLSKARYNPKDTYRETDWVVEGLAARRALTGHIGPEKSLKSVMDLQLGMHIACGRDFFGFRVPKARRVVYFDAENPSETIDERYKALLKRFSEEERAAISKNLDIVKGRELINAGVNIEADNRDFWKAFTKAYPAEVYILDAFQMFHSKQERSNQEMKRVMLQLRSHCGPENCLFISHHTRKREDREVNRKRPVRLRDIGARVWSDKCLGAGVFKRLADVIICQEVAEERNREREVTDWTVDFAAFGRITEDIPLLQFEPDGDYWLRLLRKLSPTVQDSLNKLKAARGPWRSKNAAAAVLGLSRSQGNLHINQLLRKEYLRIDPDGGVSLG